MSCEESAIFFANLAFLSHIRQHHSTSLYSSTKIAPKKLISTEVIDIILSLNASSTFSKLMLNKKMFDAVILEAIEATQKRPMGQKLEI